MIKNSKNNTLCFTGHRPNKLVGYDRNAYKNFINDLAIRLETYVTHFGIINFISGGAQGFDQLAFWAIEKLKENHPDWIINNIVYVPFDGQESRWSKFGIFSKTDYDIMIATADTIHICDENVKANDDFSLIRKALIDRNKDMVNSSCRVLAMYSHEESSADKLTPGGTAACVNYAKSIGKPIDKCVYNIINNQLILE
ncbi:SLOG family protein [Filifactor alocis]|uniref:SLOG family protein n=1 Tax=Filifactor alocis TaxID=143361 RepID=UPI003F9EC1E1